MVLSITPSEAQAILTELQPSMPALAPVKSLVLEPGHLPLTVELTSGLKVRLDLTVTDDGS